MESWLRGLPSPEGGWADETVNGAPLERSRREERTMKLVAAIVLALACATPAVSFAAQAGADEGAMPVKVAYGDLNLGNPRDAARLLQRIDSAATEACGAWVSSNPIDVEAARQSDCHKEAMKSAVDQIGAPVVSNLYNRYEALASNPD
jgi:UrcA family protein